MRTVRAAFDYLKLKLASPERIQQWSTRRLPNYQVVGEILNAETVHYRTSKPVMGGLYCERIFGPSHNFDCACGKYKQVRYDGLICEKCGVEVTDSLVRRHRMGHIYLTYPAAHIWYTTSRPNYLALLLEVEQCELTAATAGLKGPEVDLWDERIKRIKIASLAYLLGEDAISIYGLHWDLQFYREARREQQTRYKLKPEPKPILDPNLSLEMQYAMVPKYLLKAVPLHLMGTVLLRQELELVDQKLPLVLQEAKDTMTFLSNIFQIGTDEWRRYHGTRKWEHQRLRKLQGQTIQRVRLLTNLIGTHSCSAWLVLTVLPVLPPSLRPLIHLESGRIASADLTELYRRLVIRNLRLLRLMASDVPAVILCNEKRLIQESVDCLIDNGRRGKFELDAANKRPLKSLSQIIKGKEGRFRQNLLGKRVDYSGRSVIVVGPSLQLHQCGLPYEMAIELFQPFLIRDLIRQNLASTMKMAKNLIKQNKSLIQPVLEKIVQQYPIFLNRAPTLHRLGVQAFEPVVVEGRAILLHPLVCSAFNADFDGDQMAVHIPLSIEAQSECYMLMFAPYNFLSPANGEPIIIPSQDMVLGCYYLTVNNIPNLLGSNHYFANLAEVLVAYYHQQVELHSTVWIRLRKTPVETTALHHTRYLPDETLLEVYPDKQVRKTPSGKILVQYLQTTPGRAIFNSILQARLGRLEPFLDTF